MVETPHVAVDPTQVSRDPVVTVDPIPLSQATATQLDLRTARTAAFFTTSCRGVTPSVRRRTAPLFMMNVYSIVVASLMSAHSIAVYLCVSSKNFHF